MRQPVMQAGLRASRLGECRSADDPARTPVGHAENNRAAAFVGQGHALLDQLVEVIVLLRLLELEVGAFGFGQPVLELFVGGRHGIRLDSLPRPSSTVCAASGNVAVFVPSFWSL